jgi:cation diffusion facilitator family transporter
MKQETNLAADQDKLRTALTSVLAAVLLTTMKLVVGLLTASLGILSEALHSGLDLAAAAVTYLAVRASGKPADSSHTYGHGKIENLSALFETLLLLATCVWIIYEAIQRLFFKSVEIEASVWAFAVMGISIIVDVNRSRMLYRAARKHKSQALEADALHFHTDIWSSSVVIGGLVLVVLAEKLNLPRLAKADSIAALGVAGIVIYVSVQLGKRTIDALMDAVPPGLQEAVAAAAKVAGVERVERARVRVSGPEEFVDLALVVHSEASLEEGQHIADRAEQAVREILPHADVVVQIAPLGSEEPGMLPTVRRVASQHGLSPHGMRLYRMHGERTLELHVEVDSMLTVEQAHQRVSAFEEQLQQALGGVKRIVTHIEPGHARNEENEEAAGDDQASIAAAIEAIENSLGMACHIHHLEVTRAEGEVHVSFHCRMPPQTGISEAHALTERMEQELRARVPGLGRVLIHVEPQGQPED